MLNRDEAQEIKRCLENELHSQQAKAQALLRELETCKVRIIELRSSIVTCTAILGGTSTVNGKTEEPVAASAPD